MNSLSIHPRVQGNRTVHKKVNTSKPPKNTPKFMKAMARYDARASAYNSMTNSQKEGHRAPGSRRQDKN